MANNKHEDCLEKAAKARDRYDYQNSKETFISIAKYWTLELQEKGLLAAGREITPKDAIDLLLQFKKARANHGYNPADTQADIAGYAAWGAEFLDNIETVEIDSLCKYCNNYLPDEKYKCFKCLSTPKLDNCTQFSETTDLLE